MEFTLTEKSVLTRLYRAGAIKIGQKTQWKDGLLSPFYMNLREPLLKIPDLLWELGELFFKKIKEVSECSEKIQAVVGVPEAGNPLAIATSLYAYAGALEIEEIPVLILRSQSKKHGTRIGSLIIGEVNQDWEYNLLDDVFSTGTSKLDAIRKLEDESIRIKRIIAAFDHQLGGKEALIRDGYDFEALFETLDVVKFYLGEKLITKDQYSETVEFIKKHQFD